MPPVVWIVRLTWSWLGLPGGVENVQLMPTVPRFGMNCPSGPVALIQENVLAGVPTGTGNVSIVWSPGGAGGGGAVRITGTEVCPTCIKLSVAVTVTVYVPAPA